MVQTSSDRLDRAVAIANIWKGPMSVTLFVRSTEEDLTVLERVWGSSEELQTNADVHLFFDKAKQNQTIQN